MSPISKVLIAAIAAFSVVNAYPSPQQNQQTTPAVPANNDELIATLLTKSSAIKRFQTLLTDGSKLLSKEELAKKTVFDFNNASPAKGADGQPAKGGAAKAANIDTFPILTGLGISTTVAILEPCGINTPHVHPRATEFLTVTSGTIAFGYILENGLTAPGNPAEVSGSLSQFQGTVFPMGSIHYQFNPRCDQTATFVATLNSEDPGTNQVAQGFFGLDGGVVSATLGGPEGLKGEDIEGLRKNIPVSLAQAVDTCLAMCKKA